MTDYDNMPAGEEMDMLIAWQVFQQENFNHLPLANGVCPRCQKSGLSLIHPCVKNYSADVKLCRELLKATSPQRD